MCALRLFPPRASPCVCMSAVSCCGVAHGNVNENANANREWAWHSRAAPVGRDGPFAATSLPCAVGVVAGSYRLETRKGFVRKGAGMCRSHTVPEPELVRVGRHTESISFCPLIDRESLDTREARSPANGAAQTHFLWPFHVSESLVLQPIEGWSRTVDLDNAAQRREVRRRRRCRLRHAVSLVSRRHRCCGTGVMRL